MDNKQSSGDKSEQIADIVKGTSKFSNIKQLANTFLMLLVLLAFAGGFAYIGVSWYICLGVVIVAFAFFGLGIIRYRRISAAVNKADAGETIAEADDITLDPGEFLVNTIPAVMDEIRGNQD